MARVLVFTLALCACSCINLGKLTYNIIISLSLRSASLLAGFILLEHVTDYIHLQTVCKENIHKGNYH